MKIAGSTITAKKTACCPRFCLTPRTSGCSTKAATTASMAPGSGTELMKRWTLKCDSCKEAFTPVPGTENCSPSDMIGIWMAKHVEEHGGNHETVTFSEIEEKEEAAK